MAARTGATTHSVMLWGRAEELGLGPAGCGPRGEDWGGEHCATEGVGPSAQPRASSTLGGCPELGWVGAPGFGVDKTVGGLSLRPPVLRLLWRRTERPTLTVTAQRSTTLCAQQKRL